MRLLRRLMPGTEPIDVLAIFGYFRRIRSSPVGEKNQEIAASKASGCRRWYGGTRRSCAPTTSKKPSSCSGITSSPSGPAATWRNGCAQPCVPGWNRSRVHQPSFIRVPHCRELHCSDRSLLRPATPTSRTLITLLGQEPEFVNVLSFTNRS